MCDLDLSQKLIILNFVFFCRADALVWLDNAIPADEVRIKLAGDKSGITFKPAVQIANVAAVNSVKNTSVIT